MTPMTHDHRPFALLKRPCGLRAVRLNTAPPRLAGEVSRGSLYKHSWSVGVLPKVPNSCRLHKRTGKRSPPGRRRATSIFSCPRSYACISATLQLPYFLVRACMRAFQPQGDPKEPPGVRRDHHGGPRNPRRSQKAGMLTLWGGAVIPLCGLNNFKEEEKTKR